MDPYNLWLLLAGLACFGAAWLPHLLYRQPFSFSMAYVGAGVVLFSLPLGLETPNPLEHPEVAERISELVVIVALMGVGLKLERPLGWKRWGPAWRLLSVTMISCIAAFAFVGWWAVGLAPASALLLGAVLAPTDPVLAAAVQADPPMEEEGEVHFALTAEAGLNDGLAFPFTNLAIAVATGGLASVASLHGLADWVGVDVLYKIGAGLVIGGALGYLGAQVVFRFPGESKLARTGEGLVAPALTLLVYAATELVHGYGFIAVFVAALSLRRYKRQDEYHRTLHAFTDSLERLLMAFLLMLFGGALAGGLLDGLTWPAALAALAFVLVIRPLAGGAGLTGLDVSATKKATVAFFGIRGVGSFYYLSHGLNEAVFPASEMLWAITGLVVLLSIVVHGITAPWAVQHLQKRQQQSTQQQEAAV